MVPDRGKELENIAEVLGTTVARLMANEMTLDHAEAVLRGCELMVSIYDLERAVHHEAKRYRKVPGGPPPVEGSL